MAKEKSASSILKEKLMMKNENIFKNTTLKQQQDALDFCEGYKKFLAVAKTEREACETVEKLAIDAGFVNVEKKKTLKPGDRIYLNNRGKAIILAVIGSDSPAEGFRISAAHIDSPRLDLKPNPLYEDSEMAYFKTHYYGGIKKYQWTSIPLALHGVVIRGDGSKVNICIGEDEGDPVFVINDLLPHLAKEQSKRTLSEGIQGEELNILVGSRPFNNDPDSDLIKLNILNILYEKYGITENDFITAELEAVPAFAPKDIGFDRSMIGAYGHDDRVCAYPAVAATLNCAKVPKKTVITILADKEEIGSEGNTGLHSVFFKHFVERLVKGTNVSVLDALSKSMCLSADVSGAYDPNFPEPFERRNTCFVNHGAVIMKYTGARGKGDTSDASAELMGEIRQILDSNKVKWQVGELGKVDFGGGGTVAKELAALGIDVVDLGVPVLSMHSPFEVVGKMDVYMTYLALKAFFK